MRHWRVYRNLALIYAVALVVWLGEYRRGMKEDDVYLAPHSKYTEVISQIYPQRNEPQFYAGFRSVASAKLDETPDQIREDPARAELAVKKWEQELAAAAEHYQRSVEGGMISQEMLFYQYALTLMRLRADAAQIDKAIADWRRNYPYSRLRPLEEWQSTIDRGYEGLMRQIQHARQQRESDRQREEMEKAYQGIRAKDRRQP